MPVSHFVEDLKSSEVTGCKVLKIVDKRCMHLFRQILPTIQYKAASFTSSLYNIFSYCSAYLNICGSDDIDKCEFNWTLFTIIITIWIELLIETLPRSKIMRLGLCGSYPDLTMTSRHVYPLLIHQARYFKEMNLSGNLKLAVCPQASLLLLSPKT